MRVVIILLAIALAVHAEINVACAANMQFAMKEIVDAYQAETGKIVKPVFGSSGKLSAQIQNGAPFDVFVSADMEYVEKLYKAGFAEIPGKEYARGKLVLWTVKGFDLSKGIAVLKNPDVKSIAVGDPKVTIYGPAAMQVMEKGKVLQEVQSKIVYGDNITTVAQFIVGGFADIGFANLSFTQSGPMAGKGAYIVIDSTLYTPLPQGASVLQYGLNNNPKEAKAFFEFLYSERVRAILSKHGYSLPEKK
jgi:molybdate transport system substrate-binding protein